MLSNPKLLKLWDNINDCKKQFLTPWCPIIIIGSLLVMILNYCFDDFLTLFLKTLERLDSLNIIHGYKLSAECSSLELSKTTSSSKTMSNDELQKKIDEDAKLAANVFMGCCLVLLAASLIKYFFFD